MASSDFNRIVLFHKLFPFLTCMQCKCVYYYSRGYTIVQIADHLGISHQNVNKYLHAAAEKMGVSSLQSIRMTVTMELDLLILDKLT